MFRAACRFAHTPARAPRLASAVGPALASPAPDFLGKLLALGFGRFVDDPPAFVVGTSLVGKSRLDILGEIVRAGIVLARTPSLACRSHSDSKARVTAFAEPPQIFA